VTVGYAPPQGSGSAAAQSASLPAAALGRWELPKRRLTPFKRWLTAHPAWPVTALLALYPLWWALGVAEYAWIFLAVPAAVRLLGWHMSGARRVGVPPGFGLWVMFLVWTAASVVTINLHAPGTVDSSVSNRIIAFVVRGTTYLAVTVLLLFVGNLREDELPKRKLAWLLGLLGIYTAVLGVAGIAAPTFEFSSPVLHLIPHRLQDNSLIQAQMHPALTQLQNVFGQPTEQGRPKAPFPYTNTWGDCLTLLIPWLLVAWRTGTRRGLIRLVTWFTVGLAVIALVYSLNRGAWIGVAFSVAYLAVRLALRGRVGLIAGLTGLVILAGVVTLLSPLATEISLRLHNGGSNDIRASLFALSMKDGLASPILGFGDTRQQVGSVNSIAIGPSPQCPLCGHAEVGSTGQFSLVLICSGFVGVFFYFGFFAWLAWRYRRDPTPYGWVGLLVILLSFIYMFTYDALAAPLGITMLCCGLLWRIDRERREQPGTGPPGELASGRRQIPRPLPLASRTMADADTAPDATASAR
jgi:polysaccharide biosynthesis protein PslJ